MQVLSSRIDMTAFYDQLASASERVLMLDYDGTLAPFKVCPEEAVPYPGVSETLSALMAQDNTRVVIVSGRRATEVASLLPLGRPPEIWGAHGWERISPKGEMWAQEPDEAAREALVRAHDLAERCRTAGTRLERKPASVAVHWRGAPESDVEPLKKRLADAWAPLTDGVLEVLPFDGGLELRARGTNKQHAVKAVLSETAPGSPVAYLGDDITDEDAFQIVKAQGLAVLVRPEFRETAADVWIKPPQELLAFLERWRAPGQS
jgi:trehalose 6-phosphate phosphatase